ncbi:DinB family protein [Elizabethkingia anophelis]|nr:DinB family protein [Elizabethkingia anophelis]MCT3695085.1 DinB family protein [Elizabethkingia anophelis]MCT3858748.1 DinB family protein [Elizabethkingia anophelis]MCT3912129.1 DinB family protein [Elizabethkingia anophelis]MCT4311380.1 DinB family protein [Elizabethkingia anophelis]
MNAPKSLKLEVIIPAYRMHTQTFLNVLDGITEEDALKRIDGRTNHIIWMAGNYVNVRYAIAHILGEATEDPYEDLFFMGKALDESFSYPSLKELKDSFHAVSPKAYQKLLEATDEQLSEMFPINMNIPFIKEDKLNFIGMCIGRQDYLCGQMGLMRRLLDYPGMKYDTDNNILY